MSTTRKSTRPFRRLLAAFGAIALLAACSRPPAVPATGASRVTPSPVCEEHRVPEDEDGICHPELLDRKKPGEGLLVRLPSTNSASEAGIAVAHPENGGMEQGVDCFAELTFNQNKLAQINPLVGGVVKSVEVDLGARVVKGALLARITSAAIGEAQSAYLRALAEDDLREKALERQRKLRDERISWEQDLQEAEAAHHAKIG